jgi:hypothetical protein
MISVVNGFVCSSGCDVEAAKKGKDPSAPPGTPPGTPGKTSGFDKQPVTILDGALKDLAAVNAVAAVSSVSTSPKPSVNLLA